MRFVCDSCRAQYMISDDKIGAKGIKVRCKKCGYNIVVRPASSGRPVGFGGVEDEEIGAVFDQVLASGTQAPSTEDEPEVQKNAVEDPRRSEVDAFDIVIVCALHSPELEKVMNAGGILWKPLSAHRDDPHVYHQTKYKTKKGNSISVVASAPNQMGLSASAVLATKMILRFRPKLVAMVGIAAGVNDERQGFGNILAADVTFDYGSGKLVLENKRLNFRPEHHPLAINPRLKARLLNWSVLRSELDDIYRSWQGDKPDTVLKLHVGPIGSGAAVIDAKQPVLDVIQNWRKLTGIEMEAYAVHRACLDTIEPAPVFVCIKSICDFAENKSDLWQKYAAYTAAEFCYRFLTHEWENLYLDGPSSR